MCTNTHAHAPHICLCGACICVCVCVCACVCTYVFVCAGKCMCACVCMCVCMCMCVCVCVCVCVCCCVDGCGCVGVHMWTYHMYIFACIMTIHLLCMIQTLMNARLLHITVNRTATTLQDHITALAKMVTNCWPMASVKVRNIDNVRMCTIKGSAIFP